VLTSFVVCFFPPEEIGIEEGAFLVVGHTERERPLPEA
jgi:hypothetical protein